MKLLVLRGDAIGPEIVGAAIEVLKAADGAFGLGLEIGEAPVGLDALERLGTTLPDETLARVLASDGIVLGPQHNMAYPPPEEGGTNVSATIRKRLDLFANVRPSRGRPGVPAPSPGIDVVVVRENTRVSTRIARWPGALASSCPRKTWRWRSARSPARVPAGIAEEACRIAASRSGRLAVVHKANVLGPDRRAVPGYGVLRRRTSRRTGGRGASRRRHGGPSGPRTRGVRRDRDDQHVRRHPLRSGR